MRMIDANELAEAMGVNRIVEQDWEAESAWGVPIVEAEPVKHGHWIGIHDAEWLGGIYAKCSVCGFGYSYEAYHEPDEFEYCPHCGAKMDEVNNEVN